MKEGEGKILKLASSITESARTQRRRHRYDIARMQALTEQANAGGRTMGVASSMLVYPLPQPTYHPTTYPSLDQIKNLGGIRIRLSTIRSRFTNRKHGDKRHQPVYSSKYVVRPNDVLP